MFVNRITRAAAVALAIAAAAAPAAVAKPVDTSAEYTLPHDFQAADAADNARNADNADNAGAVVPRGLYEPMSPDQQPQPPLDLRMPDTIDAANGRGA